MVNRIAIEVMVYFLALVSSVSHLSAQSDLTMRQDVADAIDTLELFTLLQTEVCDYLGQHHIAPPKIDDQFSTILFSNWIEIIDPDKIYLFESDMKELGLSIYNLDDQIREGRFDFFEQSYALLLNGIKRNQNIYHDLQESGMDFSIQEDYSTTGNHNTYIKDSEEHKSRYSKYAKFQVLQIFNQLLIEATAADEVGNISKDSLLALAQQQFYDFEKDTFKLLSIKDKIKYFEDYLDAIALSYDPYCEYYSELSKEEYDIALTGKLVGAGVVISYEEGHNRIVELVVGGPAWRTEQIVKGDIILGVTTQEGIYFDGKDATIFEIASKIRGKVGTNVTMHLLGSDGQQKDVKIYRKEVLSYGEQVKGLMLNKDTDTPVGYIDIRQFYRSESPGKNSSSAEDVINYFKIFEEKDVQSVVIDLRDCLGGVLDESLTILGALVGSGPLLQSRDRQDSTYVYQSGCHEIVYTGDIIVLTNQNSASAAEILASTLKDYKRAIIVGTRTFGKGTVQQFAHLTEDSTQSLTNPHQGGWLKYTFSNYYRINGDATQLVGLEPDIKLPGILDSVAVGETQMKNPILWTQIDSVDYDICTGYFDDLRMLKIKSKIRVTSNADFINVKKAAIQLQELYTQTAVPLRIADYRAYDYLRNVKLRNASNAPYSDLPLMEVTSVSLTQKLSLSAEESRWMALRSQDIYLKEAINVFADLESVR